MRFTVLKALRWLCVALAFAALPASAQNDKQIEDAMKRATRRRPGVRSQAPYADHGIYKELYIRAHLGKLRSDEEMQAALKGLRMADLREFFPHGLGKAKQGASA